MSDFLESGLDYASEQNRYEDVFIGILHKEMFKNCNGSKIISTAIRDVLGV